MLKNRTIQYFLVLIEIAFFVSFLPTNAQNHLSSPYSRFAMGDIMPRTSGATSSMGNIGYAFQSSTVVNFANPAAYVAFDTLSCLIDGSFSFKTHTLRAAGNSQKGSTVFIDYLSIGLSINKIWKTAVGFQPFTNMTYSVSISDTINDMGSYSTNYEGNGGLNEVYWGNAFRLFKGFSIGFNASFIFGKYEKSRALNFEDETAINSKIESTNRVKGLYLTFGTQYLLPIKEKGILGLGLVYTPSITFWDNSYTLITTFLGNINASTPTLLDTLYPKDIVKNKHHMPQSIGGGLSWAKPNKYHIEANFTWTNWANYTENKLSDTTLVDACKIAIGGALTPKYNSSKFIARMTFSLGGNFEKTRLMVDNEQINKFGINFGLLFPLRKSKTCIGLVLEYGQIGSTKKGLIKENYFSAAINVRLHERWYQRMKLD